MNKFPKDVAEEIDRFNDATRTILELLCNDSAAGLDGKGPGNARILPLIVEDTAKKPQFHLHIKPAGIIQIDTFRRKKGKDDPDAA